MDAVIYNRVSRLVAPEERTSTRDQERENRAWCETNGHHVVKVFTDEGKSASRYSTKVRDAWAEVKDYLQPGHLLVCWEASRHSRDLAEFVRLRELCEERGVKLAYKGRIFDMADGDDRFMSGLDSLISERESAIIKERVLRGKRNSAMDGKPNGGRVAWGYRSAGPGRWEPDPIEAPRVREAVARTLAGESQYGVLRWLQQTGWAPSSASNLRRALTNPALAGKRSHRGELYDATWEPIISAADHQAVVKITTRAYNASGPEAKYLCSGIAKCGKCGEGLAYRDYRNLPTRNPMYVCRNGCVSRLATKLDSAVEAAIMRRIGEINPEDYNSEDPRVAQAEKEIEEIETNLADWLEKATNGEVSASSFGRVEKKLKQRIAELRPRTATSPRKMLRPENWDRASIAEKRDAVRRLLSITVPSIRAQGKWRADLSDVIIEPI